MADRAERRSHQRHAADLHAADEGRLGRRGTGDRAWHHRRTLAGGERDEPQDHRRTQERLTVNFLKQTLAVTIVNLRTIPQRLGSSGVAIVGIAGVVIVLVSVLSIAQGFAAAMEASGSPVRALVMRSGADSEMTSGLSGPEVDIIKQAPGLRRDAQTPLASAELYVIIDIPKISTDSAANVPLRGIEPAGTALREEFSIAEGRMFEFGTNEVIVGRGASVNFKGLTVGNTVVVGQSTWKVVGLFETDGSVAETEIWCDARVLQGVYRRGNTYQSLLARLDSSDSFNTFRDWLTANPQVNVQVRIGGEPVAKRIEAVARIQPRQQRLIGVAASIDALQHARVAPDFGFGHAAIRLKQPDDFPGALAYDDGVPDGEALEIDAGAAADDHFVGAELEHPSFSDRELFAEGSAGRLDAAQRYVGGAVG